MFFTQDLLSKRDSGFGLLWLAATLGSKSAIKKLPKRQIQTVDISQLCHLICEPNEPLALRLSSNLLVGVVRVYKVKQELFMNDVNTCFISLKRVVQELRFSTVNNSCLELPQSSVRASAVTLASDNRNVIAAADFDALVANWDEYLNINGDDDDDDFDLTKDSNSRRKSKRMHKPAYVADQTHTLEENPEHLLSTSLDLSFIGAGLDDSFSSQNNFFDLNFCGEDPIMMPSDDLDVGLLADELARELGWDDCVEDPCTGPELHPADDDMPLDLMDIDMPDVELPDIPVADTNAAEVASNVASDKEINNPVDQVEEPLERDWNDIPDTQFHDFDAAASAVAAKAPEEPAEPAKTARKRPKTTRLLLDPRTELTDDELKSARARYLEGQEELKRGLKIREYERISEKRLGEIVGGVPDWIRAPALAHFWEEVYRVQVETRSGAVHVHPSESEEPLKKRRRIQEEEAEQVVAVYDDFPDLGGDAMHYDDPFDPVETQMRSSEEPGLGRRGSRTLSVSRDLGFNIELEQPNIGSESQKSSLFPWDNAGISSSVNGGFEGLAGIDPGEADVRMRSSSHRGSPLHSGIQVNSVGLSPASLHRRSQSIGEDFAFDVADADRSAISETQQSDVNILTLEKNSYNFLEYAKMQSRSLPSGCADLMFDTIIPQSTSTRHVAATAFYHCLVLATKDLLRVEQKEAYGPIIIRIV